MHHSESDEKDLLSTWPESKRLQSALKEKLREMTYTMPGICYEFGPPPQLPPNFKHLSGSFDNLDQATNLEAIQELLKAKLHENVLYATTMLLSHHGYGVGKAGKKTRPLTPFSLKIWSIRMQVLLGMARHKELLEELSIFEELDAPDLFFQYHSSFNPARAGSMVPFALRLVHTESLVHSPLPIASITRLTRLKHQTQQALRTVEEETAEGTPILAWKARLRAVSLLEARLLLRIQELDSCLRIMKDMDRDGESDDQDHLAMARVALVHGDEKAAVSFISEAASSLPTDSAQVQEHRAFHAIFCGRYTEAKEFLSRERCSSVSTPSLQNTAALCWLYAGDASTALSLLLKEVKSCQDSGQQIHSHLITNIRSLTELVCSTEMKKRVLAEWTDLPIG